MNPNHYFGGTTVRDGRVRRLGATTFTELLDHYLRQGAEYPYTRAEFNALSVEERNTAKDTDFFTAATYDYEVDGPRNDANAIGMTAIVLDLDEGQFVKDLFESPEAISEHLHGFAHAVWTTAKHTAEAPRLKILIPTQGVLSKDLHRPLVRAMADLIGAPKDWKGRIESSTLSLPQYRPPRFKDEEFGSLLVTVTDGRGLTAEDVPEDEEDGTRVYVADSAEDPDAMSLAHLPAADITVEDLRDPLFKIDPDVDYMVWTEIIRALRHQFSNDEDDAREAFELFDEWSSGGTKYRGSEDTYAKWRPFKAYPKGRVPITVRTLFHHAMELGGWEPRKLDTKLKKSFQDWLESCNDEDELAREGVRRIAANPFPSAIGEETRSQLLKERIKTVAGRTVTLKSIRDDINRQRKIDREEKHEKAKMPPWLQSKVFVAEDNVIVDTSNGAVLPIANFNNLYSSLCMPEPGKGETPGNFKPPYLPSDYALNHAGIVKVDGLMYNPKSWSLKRNNNDSDDPQNLVGERIFKWRGKKFLNSFNPATLRKGDPKHAEKAGRLLRQLFLPLIGDEDMIRRMIDWLAHNYQYPGVKIRFAWLIQSVQGVGKGTLGQVLRACFGGQNVATINSDIMAGAWNDWMIDGLLQIFEELRAPGTNRKQVMDRMKYLVTDDILPVNKRNTSAFDSPNFANQLCFTNHRDSIALEPGDRRWCVWYSPYQTKEQVAELRKTDHFEEVQWLTGKEGSSGLAFFLANHNISDDFDPNGPAPRTRYAEEIIEQSEPKDQRALREAIDAFHDEWVKAGQYVDESRVFGYGDRIRHKLRELGYEQWGETSLFIHREWEGDPNELGTQWIMGDDFEI